MSNSQFTPNVPLTGNVVRASKFLANGKPASSAQYYLHLDNGMVIKCSYNQILWALQAADYDTTQGFIRAFRQGASIVATGVSHAAGSSYVTKAGTTEVRKNEVNECLSLEVVSIAKEAIENNYFEAAERVAAYKTSLGQPAFKALKASATPVAEAEEEIAEEETLEPVIEETATPKTGK